MLKAMLTIRFRSDMDADVAAEYWRTVHRDLVLATPGMVAYAQNRRMEQVGGPVSWDGIVQLSFEDERAFREALASEHWASVIADAENFVDVESIEMAVVAEQVHR